MGNRSNRENLQGKRVGYLVVTKPGDEANRRPWMDGRIWHCVCDCGNSITYTTGELNKKGRAGSCGCMRTKWRISPDTPFNAVFGKYKANAKKRGIIFNLSIEEFKSLINKDCFYCGAPPSNKEVQAYGTLIYSGIDRVDNSQGYHITNCVTSCIRCNLAKLNKPVADFYSWIKAVYIRIPQ